MSFSITILFIIITVLISYRAFEDSQLKSKLLMHPQSVEEFGQFYRFVSSGFVHADWGHLGINMFVLWMFGLAVENGIGVADPEGYLAETVGFATIFGGVMGKVNFVILYIGSIIAGSIPSFIKHRTNGHYRALGASGGTAGILFAYMFFAPWNPLYFIFFPFFGIPAIVLGVLYLVYSSYMAKNGNDNIGHDAHFWGGVFGLVYTALAVLVKDPDTFSRTIGRLLQGPF